MVGIKFPWVPIFYELKLGRPAALYSLDVQRRGHVPAARIGGFGLKKRRVYNPPRAASDVDSPNMLSKYSKHILKKGINI